MPSKSEMIEFCDNKIREHAREVRFFLDLLHACRMAPETSTSETEEHEEDVCRGSSAR